METILSAIIITIVTKVIERIFEPKPQNADGILTESQIKQKKFFKYLVNFFTYATFLLLFSTVVYFSLQQKYFPRIEGCVDSSNVYVYNVPSGNRESPLSDGCYFFDAQDKSGYWLRLSDENKNLDGRWIQSSTVEFRFCSIDSKGSLVSCIFNN